jgi:hypothetical protein
MALRDDIERELRTLHQSGGPLPGRVQASDPQGISVRIEVTAVDSMSCEFSELEVFVPSLQNSTFDKLKQWASDLSRRITYLLEQIGPLEFDPQNGQVLIRSTPPGQLSSGTQYYEIVLSGSGSGSFVLRRFRSVAGQPGRSPVNIQVTIEVLLRLVDDLLDTIPNP